MILKRFLLLASLCGTTALAACGGGGGGASGSVTPPGGGGGISTQAASEDAIGATNAVGSPVKDFSSYDESTGSPLQSVARKPQALGGGGLCNNGEEFFSPDINNDPNSTERIQFYDNTCTMKARDAVRIYTSTGANSETVNRTVSYYALNATSPSAVRTETVNYFNASFDQFGYPVYKNGFARTHAGELDLTGVKTEVGDGELVVMPTSSNVSTFCSDSAGYNATGDAALGETFGWAGVMPTGTRSPNQDGSVTWSTTHSGTVYTGAIGGLSIQTGTQNTTCPVSTPMFTLAGGTAKGTYNLPVTATFLRGVLTNLTITNATLLNGDTLNVQTNSGVAQSDPHFISGTLAKNGSTAATFNVDAFGDGTLIVSASGKAYQIDDWHVVK